jgi:hypothetical protein
MIDISIVSRPGPRLPKIGIFPHHAEVIQCDGESYGASNGLSDGLTRYLGVASLEVYDSDFNPACYTELLKLASATKATACVGP